MREKNLVIAFCLGIGGMVTVLCGLVMAEKMMPMEGQTYMPVVIEKSFEEIMEMDVEVKPKYDERQQELLERRYDLSDMPSDTMMSAGRKPVQKGVRVKLHGGVTWEELSEMTPAEIKNKGLFPMGFRPLPHSKHGTGGQVFPQNQIDAMQELENRNLERFDTEFDIPTHFTPEYPPPIYLTNRPDLGDVSQARSFQSRTIMKFLTAFLPPFKWKACGCCSPLFRSSSLTRRRIERSKNRAWACRASTAM